MSFAWVLVLSILNKVCPMTGLHSFTFRFISHQQGRIYWAYHLAHSRFLTLARGASPSGLTRAFEYTMLRSISLYSFGYDTLRVDSSTKRLLTWFGSSFVLRFVTTYWRDAERHSRFSVLTLCVSDVASTCSIHFNRRHCAGNNLIILFSICLTTTLCPSWEETLYRISSYRYTMDDMLLGSLVTMDHRVLTW